MKVVAIYNMKGGVGKTTTAVNLAYLSAVGGARTLLWDLDPQAAASFALRVRPYVEGFNRNSLENGQVLGAAIKETDHGNLDVLPADFAYRKLDRFLDHLGKPARVVTTILDTLRRDYDVMFLDCPPGFSRLTEGILGAADAVLVPAIPTVFSLRTVARVIKWADRSDSRSDLAVFFNMVDRRKALHRQAYAWSLDHPHVFLAGHIPYASVVEQMGVRRRPLPEFAPRDPATSAFSTLWTEFHTRLARRVDPNVSEHDRWMQRLQATRSVIARIESVEAHEPSARRQPDQAAPGGSGALVVHSFDTERRDLQRCGHVLELCERDGRVLVVAARAGCDDKADGRERAQAQIDSSWAVEILSGAMSPLAALDRRFGQRGPAPVENVRAIVGEEKLHRVDSRMVPAHTSSARPNDRVILFPPAKTPRRQALAG